METSFVDPDTLKGMLDDPRLLVVDVRAPAGGEGSHLKIKGAVWHDRDQVAAWGATLPRDKKIVVY